MRTIPIAKPYLTDEDAQLAYETILSGWVTQGPKVREFEREFAGYVGSKHAIAVSSCTAALHLALIVAGIREDDEVVCPSLSFLATANAVQYVGARPVFAEIDPETYNLDVKDVEARITEKTRAIILVHQIGMPGAIDDFTELCKKYNLHLIEDAACGIGSEYQGKKIGSHSELVCFSFHPRKVITTGDGGMICTSNDSYAERLRLLRQHGMSVNDRTRHESKTVIIEDYVEVGYNYRMTDIQAALGIQQLKKLDWLVNERRKIALRYIEAFSDIDALCLPFEPEGSLSNYQSFSVYLNENCQIQRDELMQCLLDKGIATRAGVMTAHRTAAYKNLYGETHLPLSEKACDRSILLPLYVPMAEEDVEYVIRHVKAFL